uniref:Uncharacterized protein n=1 Tax=Cyanoderma ruficeps TaxID=181631 RepID=A0A8C3QKH8_9PASS
KHKKNGPGTSRLGFGCGCFQIAPDTPWLLLACPDDWVGYCRICCFLLKDHRIWDQDQAQCSEPPWPCSGVRKW